MSRKKRLPHAASAESAGPKHNQEAASKGRMPAKLELVLKCDRIIKSKTPGPWQPKSSLYRFKAG